MTRPEWLTGRFIGALVIGMLVVIALVAVATGNLKFPAGGTNVDPLASPTVTTEITTTGNNSEFNFPVIVPTATPHPGFTTCPETLPSQVIARDLDGSRIREGSSADRNIIGGIIGDETFTVESCEIVADAPWFGGFKDKDHIGGWIHGNFVVPAP